MGALLCQYHNHITSMKLLQPNADKGLMAQQYTLISGTKISLFVNHPALYSPRWQQNLQEIIDIPSLDPPHVTAVVLGTFNLYRSKFSNAATWRLMKAYALQFPHHQVQLIDKPLVGQENYNRGLSLSNLLAHYAGPVVWHSMLARSNEKIHQPNLKLIQKLQDPKLGGERRTNVRSVYARQYQSPNLHDGNNNTTDKSSSSFHTPNLLEDKECSTNGGKLVRDCQPFNANDDQDTYHNGHKCMGKWGGQPDLVAWDIIEALWDVLLYSS